jgi:hypothetical protein
MGMIWWFPPPFLLEFLALRDMIVSATATGQNTRDHIDSSSKHKKERHKLMSESQDKEPIAVIVEAGWQFSEKALALWVRA